MKYYSEDLNEKFDTIEDLEIAEKAAKEEAEKKATLAEVKKSKAEAISKAYKSLVEIEKEARELRNKEIAKANEKYETAVKNAEADYNTLKNEFIKEYGSYHLSYYDNNGKEEIAISDIVNSLFDSFNIFKLF